MRTVGSSGDVTQQAIRAAAIDAIAEHGFKNASLRMIAKGAGLQAGSLYNYIKSKEHFLFSLISDNIEQMIAQFEASRSDTMNPSELLEIFIKVHFRFYTEKRNEVYVGVMEMRNLSEEHSAEVRKLQNAYLDILRKIIDDGTEQGIFRVLDRRVASLIVMSMLSGICEWYDGNGRLSDDELRRIHTDMVFNALGISSAA